MALLNAFVDSVLCVGFSSESGITIDPESKNDESFYTSYLQSTILAIVTSDRAIYPPSHGSELYDSAYPPTRRLSTHSNASVSISSGRSTPSSSIVASIRTPKHHMIPPAYKDLPFFCFPDGVQATYQREKEKIHHFVLTHGNKRSYALALTFQQQFTLRSNKPDDDGVYQIKDYRASTGHTGRSTVSRIPVPIEKPKPVSPPSPTTSPVKMRSKKMPSSYRAVDANSNNQQKPSTTSSDATKQQQPLHHYEVQTYSSYQKSLAKSAAPPPLRAGRTQSQDNLSQSNTPISTTSGSTGMRKRSGSTLNNSSPANATHTSIPIPSSSASSSPSSITTTKTTISTSSHDTVKPFYLPHCIVLISNEPYWTALQETISIIHDELTRLNIEPSSKTYKKLIQKYAFLACNTPIPPVPWERFSLSFNVTNDQFVITFEPPINPNRPVLDLDLSRLLLTLNIGKLLDVLAAIFTEQPIIFFSTNYSTLVTTLECILYLIYPLKWTNVYLPLIPDGLRDIYLEGPPGLYLKGAHSRHQAIVEQLNTSIICNLDTDKNIFVPKRIELHRIPPTKINSFIDPITQLLEEIKVARALKSVPTAARLRMEQERELERQRRYETNQKIIKLFLSLMIDICGDVFEPIYWKVNSQQISPTSTLVNKTTKHKRNTSISHTVTTTTTTTTSVFSKEQYLLPKSEGIELEFYRAFVETIAFQNLLKAEMLSTSSTSFKQICQLYSLKNEDQFCDLNNASANMLDDESKITLCDPLTTQMLLPLPDWSSDLSIHYLDNCIDVFTDELENAQEERSSAVITVYSYLRGCARLARGDYLEGLRDLYSIENEHLFPKTYIETVVLPRLAEDNLLNLFLNETYYTKSPEWKKVHLQSLSPQLSYVDLEEKKNLIEAFPVHTPSPDVTLNDEWSIIVENTLTYEQFSERVHRFNIVLDKETTETLFRALLYWTDSSSSDTLKKIKH